MELREARVWAVEGRVRAVECRVWAVDGRVWAVEGRVWAVEGRVWAMVGREYSLSFMRLELEPHAPTYTGQTRIKTHQASSLNILFFPYK